MHIEPFQLFMARQVHKIILSLCNQMFETGDNNNPAAVHLGNTCVTERKLNFISSILFVCLCYVTFKLVILFWRAEN